MKKILAVLFLIPTIGYTQQYNTYITTNIPGTNYTISGSFHGYMYGNNMYISGTTYLSRTPEAYDPKYWYIDSLGEFRDRRLDRRDSLKLAAKKQNEYLDKLSPRKRRKYFETHKKIYEWE